MLYGFGVWLHDEAMNNTVGESWSVLFTRNWTIQ